MKYNKKKAIIWDSNEPIPKLNCLIILWNVHSDDKFDNVISILDLIDLNSLDLKNKYLKFIWDLGETKVNNERLIDKLNIRPNLSFWWLTLFTEKSIYKSPQINEIIKLFAFENFINKSKIEIVEINSLNNELIYILKKYTNFKSIKYIIYNKFYYIKITSRIHYLYIYEFLFSLINCIVNNFLYNNNTNKLVYSKNNQISLFDYFLNFNQETTSIYDSDYWRSLNGYLKSKNYQINYFHILVGNGFGFKNKAIKKNKLLNNINNENHQIINLTFSFKIIYRATIDFLNLLYKRNKIVNIEKLFKPNNSELNLWPLYKNEWNRSISGSIAFKNLLLFNYFEDLCNNLPFQKIGIFLYENQNWETALTNAWKRSRQGKLLASSHSTVRFWDFRYFQYYTFYSKDYNFQYSKPDLYLFNGLISFNLALKNNYPNYLIYEVEALRYLNTDKTQNNKILFCNKTNILICGDYNNTETNKLLQMIGNIYNKLPNNYLFTFKPHPASKFKYNFNFPLKCSNDKLNNLLHTHDIIVTTNSTSAVVDAYIMNKRVLQLINYGTLNFSPFYNIDNNIFFSNSDQLFLKLLNHKSSFNEFHFFNLDNQIPKWKNLLNKYL
jgi:surface carbohydrate biosynthesis protein (TIGR04326 family)